MDDSPQWKYWAFISYSHRDTKWSRWLHKAIEGYRVPRRLVGTDGRDGPLPRRLFPVFRDRDELPTSSDLATNIRDALEHSRSLIIICSPNAAASMWVNEEVKQYKAMGRSDRILCLITGGEPNASDKPGGEPEECFPPAIRFHVGPDGQLTDDRVEPIAADVRPGTDPKAVAKLRILAGMLGVSFDTLRQREKRRKIRRTVLAALAGVLLLGTVVQLVSVSRRRTADLLKRYQDGLAVAAWTEPHMVSMEELVSELKTMDVASDQDLRGELHRAFASSVSAQIQSPRLRAVDVARIRRQIAVLRSRRADLTTALEIALAGRLRHWAPVIDLKPPFANVAGVFTGGGAIVHEGKGLSIKAGARTAQGFDGAFRAHLTLATGWHGGLPARIAMVTEGAKSGLTVELLAQSSRYHGGGAGPDAEAAPDAAGRWLKIIIGTGRPKRVEVLRMPDMKSPCDLAITVEGSRVAAQIGELPEVEAILEFPCRGAPRLVFSAMDVTRLRVTKSLLPPAASPLERGDDLFIADKLEEALGCFSGQAIETSDPLIRDECNYKAAMCLLGLGREADALRLFMQAASTVASRWSALAAARMWVIHLQKGRHEDAARAYALLAGQYSYEQLARIVPEDLRESILAAYMKEANRMMLAGRHDPAMLETLEQIVTVDGLLRGRVHDRRWAMAYWRHANRLVDALAAAGEYDRAMLNCRRMLTDADPTVDTAAMAVETCERYGALLRATGSSFNLEPILRALLYCEADTPNLHRVPLLLELARCRVAAKDSAGAAQLLETYFEYEKRKDASLFLTRRYRYFSSACMMMGFLAHDAGKKKEARDWWQRGRYAVRRPDHLTAILSPDKRKKTHYLTGEETMNAFVLMSLSGKGTTEETQALMVQAAKFAGGAEGGASDGIRSGMLPIPQSAVLRMCFLPRGWDIAREVAFGTKPKVRMANTMSQLLCYSFFSDCTDLRKAPKAVDKACWDLAGLFFQQYSAGKVKGAQFMQLGLLWNGFGGSMIWEALRPRLSKELRAPLGYVMGERLLQIKQPGQALAVFRSSLKDAGTDKKLADLITSAIARADDERPAKKP